MCVYIASWSICLPSCTWSPSSMMNLSESYQCLTIKSFVPPPPLFFLCCCCCCCYCYCYRWALRAIIKVIERSLLPLTRMHRIIFLILCRLPNLWFCLMKLSLLILCAPVFIFTSGSSAHLGRPHCGLSIWLSLLAIFNTRFWGYVNYFTRKRTKHENTRSAFFVWYENGRRRLLGAQSINTESAVCSEL